MGRSIIYLARHGNSLGNAKHMILSIEEDILTDLGKTQAGLLGEHLSDVKFTRAYCSTIPRTFETASIVLKTSKMSNTPKLMQDNRIVERGGGDFEGKPYSEPFKLLAAEFKEGRSYFEWNPPTVETWENIYGRIENFFDDLCQELDTSETDENVLIVSHMIVIQAIMKYLSESKKYNVTNWNATGTKGMRNAGYMNFALETKPGGFKTDPRPLDILKLHESNHLSNLPNIDTFAEFVNSPRGKPFAGCVQV